MRTLVRFSFLPPSSPLLWLFVAKCKFQLCLVTPPLPSMCCAIYSILPAEAISRSSGDNECTPISKHRFAFKWWKPVGEVTKSRPRVASCGGRKARDSKRPYQLGSWRSWYPSRAIRSPRCRARRGHQG